jgi:hypothetical protein
VTVETGQPRGHLRHFGLDPGHSRPSLLSL